MPTIKKVDRRISHAVVVGLLFSLVALPLRSESDPLTLEEALRLALTRNEQALIAGERENVFRARVAKALSYFFPNISANATYTRRPFEVKRSFNDQDIVIQSLNAIAGNLSLNMVLFDSTGIPAFVYARLEGKAEKLNASENRRQLAFEVATAFMMTLSIDRVHEATRHRFEYAKQSLDAAQARYAAGLVSVNDVTRAELEFATAENGMIQAQGQVETSILQLGFLLDMPVSGKLEVPQFLLEAAIVQPPLIETEVPVVLKRRLDLQVMQLHARAARSGVSSSTLKWLPSISLTGQYRYTNEAGLTGKSTNWNVGLSMNWSLFDGLNRNADYREKRALARIAELDAQAARRRSELEVRGAWVSVANQQAVLKQAQVAFSVAEKNARETAELYRQGLASALASADANVRLFESEVAMVNAQYGLALVFLNLRAAQGLDPFGKEPQV